jgi:DNA polymerase-3 subunit delta
MKIPAYKVDGFIAKPDASCRIALIYGPDHGLMKERADILAKKTVPDINDPFNVSVLDAPRWKDDPSLLEAEAQSQSLMGGRRLVRVLGAEDTLVPALQSYLKNPNPEAFIILEGGDFGPKSKLRAFCEKETACAALPCYADDADSLRNLVRQTMQTEGWQVSPDALAWLANGLTGDRLRARSELQKLALYMGKGDGRNSIRLEDARAAIADVAEEDADLLIYALGERHAGKALAALQRLEAAGEEPVGLIRMLSNHFRRLHKVKCEVVAGRNTIDAIEALQPAVFYKHKDSFKAQVDRWSMPMLTKALHDLWALEARMKTSTPARQAGFGQALLQLIA